MCHMFNKGNKLLNQLHRQQTYEHINLIIKIVLKDNDNIQTKLLHFSLKNVVIILFYQARL